MPEPTPAEELRTAAATLRRQAADDEHWGPLGAGEVGGAVPALARPLADWLDAVAGSLEVGTHPGWHGAVEPHALACARAINSKEH